MERKDYHHRGTKDTEKNPQREAILSRHRLPRVYRLGIAGLWITPIFMLVGAILVSRGATMAMLDPRFCLPLGIMMIPAWYIWREGVDVLSIGILRRVHWP